MTLTDGSPVDFTSCHDCEHKNWSDTAGDLALTGVLDRTRRQLSRRRVRFDNDAVTPGRRRPVDG